jgi:hypothetical protein
MPKSTYLNDSYINVLRGIPFVPPAALYVALFTVAPGIGGGGTEVSLGGYARQLMTLTAPSSGQSANVADVLFPVASLDWGTVVAFAIFDASAAGNLLYFGNLSAARLIQATDQIRFPAGQLIATET